MYKPVTKRKVRVIKARPRRESAAKRAVIIASLLLLIGAGVSTFFHFRRAARLGNSATAINAQVPLVEASLRPKYPYSVIPGGVYSAAELRQAIKRDPSLRSHYAGFDVNHAKLVRLTADHYAYVSFKQKNQIFWTRRRLKLPKGEALLSDGSQYVRCRCGNRLSDKAQTVVAPAEPLETALSLPPMTMDNLRDFDFAEAPRVSDAQLPLILDQPRQFDADSLQDDSEARILLKNPPPTMHASPWLAALPLAAVPFLAFEHGQSTVQPSSFNPTTPGGTGGNTNPNFPIGPSHGGGDTPQIPPVSSEPEPIELAVELVVVSGLIATRLGARMRRRPR